jgi:hypothetical protein
MRFTVAGLLDWFWTEIQSEDDDEMPSLEMEDVVRADATPSAKAEETEPDNWLLTKQVRLAGLSQQDHPLL